MFDIQSTPEKLLDQTKETIFIIALGKIRIFGGNRKWVVWEAQDRFCIFEIIIPKGLSKIIQRVCNLVFQILWELCLQNLKNHEDKAKRLLLEIVSMAFICPVSNGIFTYQSLS